MFAKSLPHSHQTQNAKEPHTYAHKTYSYWACIEMDDAWCAFPWDAHDIYTHTRLAEGSVPDEGEAAAAAAAADDRGAAAAASAAAGEAGDGGGDARAAPPPEAGGAAAAMKARGAAAGAAALAAAAAALHSPRASAHQ